MFCATRMTGERPLHRGHDLPRSLVAAIVYELPVGKGKASVGA